MNAKILYRILCKILAMNILFASLFANVVFGNEPNTTNLDSHIPPPPLKTIKAMKKVMKHHHKKFKKSNLVNQL